MDKFIGVAFQTLFPLVLRLTCATVNALAVFPGMPNILEADIAVNIGKFADGIGRCGVLGAIERAPRQKRRKLGYGNAVNLIMQNMIKALLQVRKLFFKPGHKPFGNFPQKNAGLADRIQKFRPGILKQLLRQQIQHGVCDAGRREDFVIGEIGLYKATFLVFLSQSFLIKSLNFSILAFIGNYG